MLRIALVMYGLMSCASFVAYAIDKRAAGRGDRRIPERTLHLLDLLAGWPGGLLGVYLLRHKSSKPRFKVVLWATIAAHIAVWLYLALRR